MNFLLRSDADQGRSFTFVYQFPRVHVMSFNLWWFINNLGSKSLFPSFLFGITRDLEEIESQGILQADLCNLSVMWRKCVLIVVLIACLELQGKLGSDIHYEYWSLIAIQQFLRIASPKEETSHVSSSIAAFGKENIELKVHLNHIKFYKKVKFDSHLEAKKERKFLQNLPHKCNLLLSLEYSKIYL